MHPPRLYHFNFLYALTDGRVFTSGLWAKGWEEALDAVQKCQGWQTGATVGVYDADTLNEEYSAEPPDCPVHLQGHPAARMSR